MLFNPPPTLQLSADTNALCVAGYLQFNDSSITGNITDSIVSWFWNFGDGTTSTLQNPNHYYAQSGNLSVVLTVTTIGGCTNNNSASPLLITTNAYPIANFSVNSTQIDLPFDATTTHNQSFGASQYLWDFGDGFQSREYSPTHSYETVGKYNIQLIATSTEDCSDTALVSVSSSADVIFPNVFTPNSHSANGGTYKLTDLDNDVFFPFTGDVIDYKLQIYNRWGELIFESFDVNIGWDGYYKGVLSQQDVYVWKAYVQFGDGKTFHKSGDVTLLR